MTRNSGTGTNANVVKALALLRINWASPASPPMKMNTPTTSAVKNANATGTPQAIKPIVMPSMSANALPQSMDYSLIPKSLS